MLIRRVAVLAVSALCAPGNASAASPNDIAAAVAPEVVQVVSGGSWQDGDKKGGYRAILVAQTTEPKGLQLFMEWLAAGKDGAPPILVQVSPVKEINDLKLPDATLSMEYEKTNEFTVFVEPNDPGKASGDSFTIIATTPGKVSFTPGAPPE